MVGEYEHLVMSTMFENCQCLESIDLSGFVVSDSLLSSNKSNYDSMFANCGQTTPTPTTITINPTYNDFFNKTEVLGNEWSYSNGVYTKK